MRPRLALALCCALIGLSGCRAKAGVSAGDHFLVSELLEMRGAAIDGESLAGDFLVTSRTLVEVLAAEAGRPTDVREEVVSSVASMAGQGEPGDDLGSVARATRQPGDLWPRTPERGPASDREPAEGPLGFELSDLPGAAGERVDIDVSLARRILALGPGRTKVRGNLVVVRRDGWDASSLVSMKVEFQDDELALECDLSGTIEHVGGLVSMTLVGPTHMAVVVDGRSMQLSGAGRFRTTVERCDGACARRARGK